MTTTHTRTQWRRIAATAAMFIAAAPVGATATAIANAEPKNTFLQDFYYECISHELGENHGELLQEAHENCCTDLGGIYNIKTDECYLPDQSTGDTGGRPTAPPRATAIPHPGSNTLAQ